MYEPSPWSHELPGDMVRVQEGGTVTTEQYRVTDQTRRALTDRSHAFIGARYDSDRIAAYRSRVAESAGLGRRWQFSGRLLLSAEAGAGGRHDWRTDGSRTSEAIARLAVTAAWKFAAGSELTDEAFSEFGERNVHSESSTSFKARINSALCLKVNMTVKHDTVAREGKDMTDTISSLTLVYDI